MQMSKSDRLSVKQQRFIDFYDGNATQSAIKAGYSSKTAYSQGQRLLKKVEILNAIQIREKMTTAEAIWNREKRQAFWTQVVRDTNQKMRDRLKASELLGKSEGDFIERHQHHSEATLKSLVEDAKKLNEEVPKSEN